MSTLIKTIVLFNSQELRIFSRESDRHEKLTSLTVCQICTQEPTLPCLIDKFADIAMENKEGSLIISTAIATSIIIYAVSKSIAEIVAAWRK